MAVRLFVFDAYGTLFDVGGAARQAAAEPGAEAWADRWVALAAQWRRKQLEYSWIRAVAGAHADFWQVTQVALDWTLEAEGLADPQLRQRLLDLYYELPVFPEVPEMLRQMKELGFTLAILSNDSPPMLQAAVVSAGITPFVDAVLSIEEVEVFKPDPAVYAMVGACFGVAPPEIGFVSSNGWDACSAAAFGFHAIWVNREGAPMDRLQGRPAHELSDLHALPILVAGMGDGNGRSR